MRRSYSFSSSPVADEPMTVSIKRIAKGLASNYIHDHIQVGDTLEVMPPFGRFYTPLSEEQSKHYFLFAGGIGITPLLSNLKTILIKEPKSQVYLLYGNRNSEETAFQTQIAHWQSLYAQRLHVHYVLEQIPALAFGQEESDTITYEGRMTPEIIRTFLDNFRTDPNNSEYFICGPSAMMEVCEESLIKHSIAPERIHTEHFFAPTEAITDQAPATDHSAPITPKQLEVTFEDGSQKTLEIKSNETILSAIIRQKCEAPFSCKTGFCSMCMAKLIEGEVEMKATPGIDDDEREEGLILACQAYPLSDKVVITYDYL